MAVEQGIPTPISESTTPGIQAPRGGSLDSPQTGSLPTVNSKDTVQLPSSSRRAPRGTAAALVALMAFAPAACSTGSSPDKSSSAVTASSSPETASKATPQPDVTINTVLPKDLPAAVAAQVGSVVDIGWRTPIEQAQKPDGTVLFTEDNVGSLASGVKVGPDLIATAGHVLTAKPGTPCGDLTVSARSTDGKTPFVGNVQAETGTYSSDATDPNSYQTPDFALLKVDPKQIAGMPTARIRSTPLQPGERVYFINYQPVSDDGEDRNPMALGDLSKPAEYGGIVTGHKNGAVNIVMTGFKSYGVLNDESARGGASGGPVFDENGLLVAEVSRSTNVTQINPKLAYDIDLTGYPADKRVSTAYVQSITPESVAQTKVNLDQAPACEKTKPKIVTIQ